MVLYVNGDSHSYGQDAGGPKFSYGYHLSKILNTEFVCQANSGASNSRIIRTTRDYLKTQTPDIIVIGWSTWEREEWEYQGRYIDINVSEISSVPKDLRPKYKEWLVNKASDWDSNEKLAHQVIWEFHQELDQLHVPHLFFNCYSDFGLQDKFNWGNSYINPYDKNYTYYYWLENQGFTPSNPEYFHYGPDAHLAWADFLYPHLTKLL